MPTPDATSPVRRRRYRHRRRSRNRQHRDRRSLTAATWLERTDLACYLAFIMLFPLAMGGGVAWAQPAALGWMGGVAGLLGLAALLRGELRLRWDWSLLLFLAPLLLALLQGLPAAPLVEHLSPATAEIWNNCRLIVDGNPCLSLAPSSTIENARLFLLVALFFWLYQTYGGEA